MTKNKVETFAKAATMTAPALERLAVEKSTDRDALLGMASKFGRGLAESTDGYSIATARYVFLASEANVFGDTRKASNRGLFLTSSTEFAKSLGVSGPRVAQFRRAGWALSVGVESGTVSLYLRAPGKYDAETVDKALRQSKANALMLGSAEYDRKQAKAKADAAKAKADAKADAAKADASGEVQVTEEEGRVTVTAKADRVSVLIGLLGQITPADIEKYDGDVSDVVGALETAVAWMSAHVTETESVEVE